MSKLFSKPKAWLSIVLVLCMVATMLPAGIFTFFAGATDSDSVEEWDGETIEPFYTYYERDEDGNIKYDEETETPKRRPGSDFTKKKVPIEIRNAAQLAFLLISLDGTAQTQTAADKTNEEQAVEFTFGEGENQKTYSYYLPKNGVGFYHTTTVVLTCDIDMGDHPITSTTAGQRFNGKFDGQGHTVYNINRTSTTSNSGFLRSVGYNGVYNLTVTGSVSGTKYVGGIAGVGISAPTFQNCTFIGTVTGTDTIVGGIVGGHTVWENSPTMNLINCATSGTVTGGDNTGGLVGLSAEGALIKENPDTEENELVKGGAVSLTNCYSAMTVKKKDNSVTKIGGLTGSAARMDFEAGYKDGVQCGYIFNNCHFGGTVESDYPISYSYNPDVATNVFYKNGSYTNEASGVDGATKYNAANLAEVVTALNAGVDTLTAEGIANLSQWMAGDDYPVFVQEVPTLATLTIDEVPVDVTTKYLTSYAQTVKSGVESVKIVATPAISGTSVTLSAVDSVGNVVEVAKDGTVALAAGRTTTVTITMAYKQLAKQYVINLYREPVPWNGEMEKFANYTDDNASSLTVYEIANAEQLYFFARLLNEATCSTFANNHATATLDGKEYSIYTTKENYPFVGATVKLTADIDLGDKLFPVIGYGNKVSVTRYLRSVTIDGGNHEIKGLNISSTTTYTGLFGRVDYGSVIRNLTVRGSVISTSYYVGGLVGASFNGGNSGKTTLENCAFIGNVSGTYYCGGLIGFAKQNAVPSITNCYSAGTLTAQGSSSGTGVGGLVGSSEVPVTFTNCYSTMTITPWETNAHANMKNGVGVGGLVGMRSTVGAVTFDNCYFAGDVCSAYPIAPDLGEGKLIINNKLVYMKGSYDGTAAGSGAGADNEYTAEQFADGTVAGLLGNGWTTYDGVPVLGTAPTFDLDGGFDFDPAIKEYSVTSNGTAALNVTNVADGTIVTVTADNAAKLSAVGNTYTVTTDESETVVVTVTARKGNIASVYTITVNDARWNGLPGKDFAGGDGTSEKTAYEIANAAQLAYLAEQVNAGTNYSGKFFKQTADINLGNKPWKPIGGNGDTKAFAGSFNGGGYKITGLYYYHDEKTYGDGTATEGTTPDEIDSYPNTTLLYGDTGVAQYRTSKGVGLFGRLDGASLTDVHVVNGHVETDMYLVGGLAGYATGTVTIKDSSYTGKVISGSCNHSAFTGALLGQIEKGTATIDNCYTEGQVIANRTVLKYKSTLTTSTQNPYDVGGLVGRLDNTTLEVTNSHSSVSINPTDTTAHSGTGGLVGTVYAASGKTSELTVENSYFDGAINSTNRAGGIVGMTRTSSATAGEVTLTIKNSYSLANFSTASTGSAGIFGGLHADTARADTKVTIQNCYYYGTTAKNAIVYDNPAEGKTMTALTVSNSYYLTGLTDTTNSTAKSVEEFANGNVAGSLADGWATSSKGYPVRSTFKTPSNALDRIGTSIRTLAPGGMRFYFKMTKDARNTAGIKEYGVVLAKADNAKDGLFFRGSQTAAVKAFDVLKGEDDVLVRVDETHNYFTAFLTFKTEKNFNTAYTARAYALYMDDKGQELIVYSDTTTEVKDENYDGGNPIPCTLFNVATLALNEPEGTFSSKEEEFLNSIVKGSTTTLNNTYYKLKNSETLNVAYFGGSVTAGHNSYTNGETPKEPNYSNSVHSWRAITTKWLTDQYPNATINEVNGAIGGTGTLYGAHRVVDHLQLNSVKPDLVFVEFASNDFGDYKEKGDFANYDPKEYMEHIIRTIYQYAPKADIVMVFITNSTTTNNSKDNFFTKKAHKEVADAYGIPTIDVGARLYNEIVEEAGATGKDISEVWSKYFSDNVHPATAGYRKYADYVIEYLDGVLGKKFFMPEGTVNAQYPKEAIYSKLEFPRIDTFDGETLTDTDIKIKSDKGSITSPKGLITTSKDGATFTFKFKGTHLWFWLYGSSKNVVAGKLEVVIDNGDPQYFEFEGIENHKIIRIAEDLAEKQHEVTVTLRKNSAGNANLALHYIMMQGGAELVDENTNGIYDVK